MNRTDRLVGILLELQARGELRAGDLARTFEVSVRTIYRDVQAPEHAAANGVELYLLVDDVDAAYQTWRARGVEMVTEPHDEPFGRTFAFRDADGRVLHAYAAA